ncbi:MAG TPA: plasmid pRiA4b ORF-3 family protein, partial [Vicinamibacterales bacterium]|nr:plasmid pRiA4b ORF-3 family protein [Vicinamibacterales bacterium]
FGDDWDHRVLVESIATAGAAAHRALCLDGARACPPEDCGGPHAYADPLAALGDPSDERHADLTDWIGQFDPEAFDLDIVNRKLARLRV